MRLPISIDPPTFAVFISLAGLVLTSILTLSHIANEGRQFRLGFIIILILIFISIIAIIFAIRPIEIAFISVVLITLITPIFLVFLVRQHYKTSFLTDDDVSQSGRINQLHNTEVNYILSCIINNIDNKTSPNIPVPNRDRSLDIHIRNFQEAFKAATRRMEFRFSILETLPDGTFDIAFATSNIDFIIQEKMKEKFRWKNTVVGCAGQCAASGSYVLCKDIRETSNHQQSKYIQLEYNSNGMFNKGCILCIPIPYPTTYKGVDKNGECLGVLSITCSKPNYLNESHITWIQKWYIDALINIILLYKLYQRI